MALVLPRINPYWHNHNSAVFQLNYEETRILIYSGITVEDDQSNLKPFQPGESGNPAGRPPGSRNLSTILKEMLEQEVLIDGEKIPFKDSIVKKLIKKANNGNLRAIQEIFDRMEGKAKQEMKIEGLPDPNITVNVIPPTDKE